MQHFASDICGMGVQQLGTLYRARQLSPVEATKALLARIARWNPALRAYITVLADSAFAAAQRAERQFLASIDTGPLQGIPVGIKDIIRMRGTRTTAGSRLLLDAPLDEQDATVVQRLRDAGAVILGKLNLHEFARGEPDANSPFGVVQNPRCLGHHTGGSSSGSAAAVAAGLAALTLGTDTGGSVQLPAALCGVVGLKPTYGLVPSEGVIPLSPSLDHVGILARSVADVAVALPILAHPHPPNPDRPIQGLRLGVATNLVYICHHEAAALVEHAREVLTRAGAVPIAIKIPCAEDANEIAKLITDVELWTYHKQFQDRESQYGWDFLEKSRAGLTIPPSVYANAKQAQTRIRRTWWAVFDDINILMLPANVAGAPRFGEETVEINGEHYPASLVTSRFDRTANLTGLPAVTLPVGKMSGILPISCQLVGPPWSDQQLLATARFLEQELALQWGIEP